MIDQATIAKILDVADIYDVVSEQVALHKRGANYIGLCPFHNEKTPSFVVSPAKGMFKCFGCGKGGNAVHFIMEYEHVSYYDALRELARRYRIEIKEKELTPEQMLARNERESLFVVNEFAKDFFVRTLHEHPDGKALGLPYFRKRGFRDDIIRKFQLGYSPDEWSALADEALAKGYKKEFLVKTGLCIEREGRDGLIDRFRGRVIFPVHNTSGKIVAFGGRIMNADAKTAKYLNSPETPIFQKRRILYNMNYARDKAFEAKNLLICEGYMDVIALDAYGIGYAVAPLGTALTEDQIMEAWKIVNEPILCFDGDNAGIKAAIRSVDRALPILKAGYSLKFMFLPDKQDPDEFLQAKGAEAFQKLMENTTPLMQLLWDKNLSNQPISTPEQKALIEKNIMEEVSKIQDEKVRSYYVQEMQKRIYENLGRGSLKTEFKKKSTGPAKPRHKLKPPLGDIDLRFILAAMLLFPELIGDFEEKLLMFDITKFSLFNLLQNAIESFHEDNDISSETIIKVLQDKGFEAQLKSLWELGMIKSQKPFINTIKHQINNLMSAVQIKQLEKEIRECKLRLDKPDVSDDDYQLYLSLKSERDLLLKENTPE